MPLIRLQNIHFSYENHPIFQDLNIEFYHGKITCLLGASGCGKTTILRLIAGLEVPQKGRIVIGQKLVSDNGKLLVPPHKRSIGYIFQNLALWPHMTVWQNISFGLKVQKIKNANARLQQIVRWFDLEKLLKKYPHQLSGGQKQLVAIARAIALNPQLLLMDEPLTNLDVKLKRKILDLIAQLNQQFDLTIIYVTHDHKEAFRLGHYIAVMSKGKIEEYGTAEQVKRSQNEYVRYFLEF